MPDEPNTPDDTDDINSTRSGDEEIVIDDAEAGFLEDRDVKTVHDDLQVLVEYDIVHFEQAGRAKRAFVPYDSIEVSLEITTPHSADDAALA